MDSEHPHPMGRSAFAIPREVAYLNAAYMAPQPLAVAAAGQAALARRTEPWHIEPTDFFTQPEALRERLARLLGTDAEAVAIGPSTSYGTATAATLLPLCRDQEVVVCAGQFPSSVLAFRDAARRAGATLHEVPEPPDGDWTTAVLERIGPQTAIASVEPCSWSDGRSLDVAAVRTATRAVGAALVVDLTQVAGAVDIDWGTLGADILVGSVYKWLLGPTSLGYAVIDPRWWDAEPLDGPWMSRAGGDDFASLGGLDSGFASGARRFDSGGGSHMILGAMAVAGLDLLLGWGRAKVAHVIAERAEAVVRLFSDAGYTPLPRGERVDHLVGLDVPTGDPAAQAKVLREHGVMVSVRGTRLRVSPHVWVDDADLERTAEALDTVRRSG